jgi:mono/diheme cytochrome c family protein
MRTWSWWSVWIGLMVASASWAQAPAAPTDAQPDASARGALLYQTHCTACHTKEMHWRDNRKAVNWPSLKAEVRRWQANASLQWSESDIALVATYLNDTVYRYPDAADRLSLR